MGCSSKRFALWSVCLICAPLWAPVRMVVAWVKRSKSVRWGCLKPAWCEDTLQSLTSTTGVLKSSNLILLLCCILTCACVVYLDYTSLAIILSVFVDPVKPNITQEPVCSNVLRTMAQGAWVKRNLTEIEKGEIEAFLLKARGGHNLPPSLQRPDGKCGNVTFDWLKSRLHSLLWFRALCNPKGDHPCCYQGHCTAASEDQCRCEECYDMRQQIHAEYSKWIPSNSSCKTPNFTQSEACDILKGRTLVFTGDSFVRHIYTALLLLVTNDLQHGAILRHVNTRTKHECRGMYMFTEKVCRLWLNKMTSVCNGTVRVQFLELLTSASGPAVLRAVNNLTHTNNSMVVMGVGTHDNYNSYSTIHRYLKPLLMHAAKSKQIWPRLLWVGPHAPGLLKTPRIPQQGYASVLKYNEDVNSYVEKWGIPVFDSFKLTEGVMSFDGAHYGLGVNMVKVRILLSYMKELIHNGVW